MPGRALVRSTTFRLVMMAAPLGILTGWAVLGFVYWATLDVMDRRTDAALDAELQELAALHSLRGDAFLIAEIQARADNFRGLRHYLLTDETGQRLAGDPAPPAEDGPSLRLRSQETGVWAVRIGRDLSEQEALTAIVGESVAAALALTVLTALGSAFAVSRTVLRRIEAVNRTARRIMTSGPDSRLHQRVPVDGSGDEFDLLATNLNRMLDRMDQTVETLRGASNDIAHSLRSPLNRLRSRLELLLLRLPADTPPDDETAAAVAEAIGHADELLGVFNALLRLARVENTDPAALRAMVDLSAVAADAAELYEALAEEGGLAFTASIAPGCAVAGDRQLIFQVIANLLDNAIKYTPAGGSVSLTLALQDETVLLQVADSGPGIPAADRERALERFTRLPRTAGLAPGVGLGLSLVRVAARVMGATLRLGDADGPADAPGLAVDLAFPVPPPDDTRLP